jgi:hypothetical protein
MPRPLFQPIIIGFGFSPQKKLSEHALLAMWAM